MTSYDELLQNLSSRLQEIAAEHPENESLRGTVARLSEIDVDAPDARSDVRAVVRNMIESLETEGLWPTSPEDEEFLKQLNAGLHRADTPIQHAAQQDTEQRRFSAVAPPPISAPLFPPTAGNTTMLPIALVEILNYSYFLHLLATDPASVLPPGKSLLSVMSKPHTTRHDAAEDDLPRLRDRVHDVVHKAFWDEAVETLSNPSPASQMPRLKRLYEDLHVAIKPLLPSSHPVLLILSDPLSPTTSPLRSAITHLREILVTLRSRCAPVRDPQFDALVQQLDALPFLAPISDMARLVVDTVRSILELSELMKEDLSQFVVGSMGEKQLRAVLRAQAAKQERDVVFQLWRPERIQELWRHWLEELRPPANALPERPQHHLWAYRLMQALELTVPVACPLPIRPASPDNYLQALVIAATLRSLVRLPLQPPSEDGKQESFMSRIWTLLHAEIDEQPGAGDTKLVNLADEVIRVRRGFSGGDLREAVDAEEEARLRAAVDRTLQPNDPVFALLQKRLVHAVADRIARPRDVPTTIPSAGQMPERMQTGRDRRGDRPRLVLDHADTEESGAAPEPALVVKGFEDEVLVKAVGDALAKLRSCVDWTEQVWPDLIETGSLAPSAE